VYYLSNVSVFQLLGKMGLYQTDLAERVAIITGAGRGIGKELARALAWLGAKVIIAEIANTGKKVEKKIRSEGGDALFVKTDVSNEQSMNELAKKVFLEYNKVDILINNAITFSFGSILEQTLANWDKVFSVNLKGAILGIKLFLPGMLEQKFGVITTVTSDEGTAYIAPYSASKTAVRSLGFSLAEELGEDKGVFAFVFEPGMVDTPGGNEAFSKLAPIYNLSLQEFIKLGSVGGFEGLMPVQYSAAGFAYTIVHAKEYHGESADPFRPLGKFGLLPGSKDTNLTESFSNKSISSIIESAGEVKKILEAVRKETEELNFFAKKWVKRIYIKRTSISIQEWIDTISELINQFQQKDYNKFLNTQSWLNSNLRKLESHFEESKADAEGYIKGAKKLKEALKVLEYRKNAITSFITALDNLNL
jgi:NAD(P)-dependent dehydrogenase (short-subunit alcohol dehydrogenase family)